MKNTLSALFLTLSCLPAVADTANAEGAYQFRGDDFVIEDIECKADALVAQIDDAHCIHKVPRHLFEKMCATPAEPYHLKLQRRECILGGRKA